MKPLSELVPPPPIAGAVVPGSLAVPLEYALPQPESRTPLMVDGKCVGVFANPVLAASTRAFLERLRAR